MSEARKANHGQRLKCDIHPTGTLGAYKYVVVVSFENGMPLLSRRRDRQTWETQGGHIEPGESPMEAARRELYEESGALEFDIAPLCDYLGYTEDSSANGMVFRAEIKCRAALPDSEMAEARLFPALPQSLTYPNVTPALFAFAQFHR